MRKGVLVQTKGIGFRAVENWEQLPEGYHHLDVPGIAVDSRDRVYLLTRAEARVLVYERDGTFVTAWGEGAFSERTHGITIGPDDSVYCTDDGNHTVHKFTPEGRLLMTLGTPGVASDTGSVRDGRPVYERIAAVKRGGPPFNQPTDVALGPNGDLYVCDGYGNARVHRFAGSGQLIQSWGEPGSGPGQFNLPHGILVDGEGRVLVADRENDRIQVFSLDGEFVEQWTDVQRPADLALDGQGRVYVGECQWVRGERSFVHGEIQADLPGRVSILDARGRVLARMGSGQSLDPGGIFSVHAICVDSRGDVYVGQNIQAATRKTGSVPAGSLSALKLARQV